MKNRSSSCRRTTPARLWACVAAAGVLVVATVVVASGVVYAEADAYGKSSPSDASARLDRAEHEVHAVRELLDHSKIRENPSIGHRIGAALGLVSDQDQQPSASSAAQGLAGRAYDRVKRSVFGADDYDTAMHKLKVAFGQEQPTVWEKIKGTFGVDRTPSSATDQLRHAFGYETPSEEGFVSRVHHALTGESESTLTKARRALGMAGDSLSASLSPSTSESAWHKVKVALGAEDPSVVERLRGAYDAVFVDKSWSDTVLHPLSSKTDLFLRRARDTLHQYDPTRSDTILDKLQKAVGLQSPGIIESVKDRYSTGLHETVESGAHMTQEIAESAVDKARSYLQGSTYDNILHRIKMAVGAEDPTVWESIQTALTHPGSLRHHMASWVGLDGMTRDDLMDRVRESLSNLDPRKRASTLDKVKAAIGWEQPSAFDQARGYVSDTAKRAVDTAAEVLSDTSVDDILHKVKVAVGAEDPSVWETIQSSLPGRGGESLGDKVRHVLGRDRGMTRSDLFERIQHSIPSLSRREPLLAKIKKAIGLEEPGLLDKLRDSFSGGSSSRGGGSSAESLADSAKELLSGDSLRDMGQTVKRALGADDATWDSVQSLFDSKSGVFDRVKNALGGATGGMSRDDLLERIQETLSKSVGNDYRRRDSLFATIKNAVTGHTPGLLERVKDGIGSLGRGAERKVEDTLGSASEILQGSTYDDLAHKVKVALGQEDATVWERIRDAWHPTESIGDKIRHAFGRDEGVSRQSLYRRAEEAVASLGGDRRHGVLHKVKVALGMEPETGLFGRAQEKLSHLFGRDQEQQPPQQQPSRQSHGGGGGGGSGSIDDALDAFRSSAPNDRQRAYQRLRDALSAAKIDTTETASSLYDLVTGGGEGRTGTGAVRHGFRNLERKMHDAYDALLDTARSWTDDVSQFVKTRGRGSSYLMQSFKEENGLSVSYTNDNGQEFMDVTGERAERELRSSDQLRLLNAFRHDFNLPPHESVPQNASIQVHGVHRPHVLLKSSRVVDGTRYGYCYDDGRETLSVDWEDGGKEGSGKAGKGLEEKRISPELQHRLMAEFRQMHGLTGTTGGHEHEPTRVRGQIHRFREDL